MKLNIDFSGTPILYRTLNKKKEIEFEFSGQTLRDLILRLIDRFGDPIQKALLDNNGDIDMEIRVILNNTTYLTENRMETILNDGDMIAFKGAS